MKNNLLIVLLILLLSVTETFAQSIVENQQTQNNAILVIVILAVLFIAVLIYRFRTTRNQKKIIERQQSELAVEKKKIDDLLQNEKKIREELKSTQAMLLQAEKMSSLGQLTAGVAHEINNPINFVSANIPPLKRDLDDILLLLTKYSSLTTENYQGKIDEILKFRNEIDFGYTINEIKSLINGIEEGSKRTAEIVKGLRNFSRLDEEGKKKTNINQGIESTLVLLRNKMNQKNIELVQAFGELSEIEGYPGQLNQVIMNLLSNAIDAIDENGKITITTSEENDKVIISIRDTGKGMSEEVKQKIFDPFFTTKDVGKGTGLGLSISHGIIEKHDGKIDVKSAVGGGTEFIISLPRIRN